MKPRTGAIAIIGILLLAGCRQKPTPTLAPTAGFATATSTVSPTLTPANGTPTPLAPTVTPLASATSTATRPPTATGPAPSTPTPTQPPVGPTATPSPTSGPPAAPTTLRLPLFTSLMAPPAGQPDIPLHGVTALAIHPDYPTVPYLAAGTNSNGVLVSWTGGQDWLWSSTGLPADTPVVSLTMGRGTTLVAIMEGGAVYRTSDGTAWEPIPGLSAGVRQVTLSPNVHLDGVMFAVKGEALLRSADRGTSWTTVLPANGCPLNATLSPNFAADRTAFAPRCNRVVRSSDGGVTWADVPPEGTDLGLGNLANLQVAPDYPATDRLLAQGGLQGLPILSADGGRTWQRAYDPDQVPFALGSLWTARFAPTGVLYAAGKSYAYDWGASLWQSTDGGQNWYGLARGTGWGDLSLAADGSVFYGTGDGIFVRRSAGWQLFHPGGNRPQLVDTAGPAGVAMARQGIDKYTSRLRLYEKRAGNWQPVFETNTNKYPVRAFAPPNYPAEGYLLVLGQDYGGLVYARRLEPAAAEPLTDIEDIPAGPGSSLDGYGVTFATDYPSSGRVDLRHGRSGALYISTDRGHNWTRPDPAEPGACERQPVSGFGALWFGNREVRNQLLCPLEDEQPYAGTAQPFERGELLRLDPIRTQYDTAVYGLVPGWQGGPHWNTLPHYEMSDTPPEPPAGLFPPAPTFFSAWQEGDCCAPDHQPMSDVLGWATAETSNLQIARQHFEGGVMVWRSDRDEILVLAYSNGWPFTYAVYAD